MSVVIAICGAPGSGKSTLTAAIKKQLSGATSLDSDDYQSFTELEPDIVGSWLKEDGNYNRLKMPGLREAVNKLRGQKYNWILLESHCGRAHSETAELVNYVVWIDTPLDIAMARKFSQLLTSTPSVNTQWLANYCELYPMTVEPLLKQQRQLVRAEADLCLDGRTSIVDLAKDLTSKLTSLVTK